MSRLCASCINNSPQNLDLSKNERNNSLKICLEKQHQHFSETITDPICQALRNLQDKIRVLDIQRNEESAKMKFQSSSHFSSDNNNNENMVNQDCPVSPSFNNATVIIQEGYESERPSNKFVKDDVECFSRQMEKDVANDALKMAEKRCLLLENQLSAMKRIFLRKVAKGTNGTIYSGSKSNKHYSTQNILRDRLKDWRTLEDTDSFYSTNVDIVEDVSNETDSDTFNIDDCSCDRHQISKPHKRGTKITHNLDEVNASNTGFRSRRILKSNRSPCRIKRNLLEHPFILGCSTSNSHNSNVTKSRSGNKTVSRLPPAVQRLTNCRNPNLISDSPLNNLRSIYSELCSEYECLLKKKAHILDSLSKLRGRDLIDQKRNISDISRTLSLKREQIRKVKAMINNFNDACKGDSGTVRWDI